MQQPTKSQSSKSRVSFLKAFWAALIWAALILLLIGLPGEDLPDIDIWEIDIEDKLAHCAVFAVLAGLLVYGTVKRRAPSGRRFRTGMAIVVMASLYGALTEVLQGMIFVSRFPSITDFIADAIGSVLGTVFAFWYFVKREKKSAH